MNRYKAISDKYTKLDQSFKLSSNEVLDIAKQLNIYLKYSKDRGYYTEENIQNYSIKFGIYIKRNIVQLGMSVKDTLSNTFVCSAPWSYLAELITEPNPVKIFLPVFCNYDDLKGILKEAFSIYEDFKKEIIKEYGNENK